MIPKVLHFIWLGPHPLPTPIETWRKHHPDWDVRVWRDDDVHDLTLVNQSIYDRANKRYNQKSDICRIEILYKYGGVYIDADIICLQPIDPLLEPDCELLVCQEKQSLLSNSIIGSSPGHGLIYELIHKIHDEFRHDMAVWRSTGPLPLTNLLSSGGHVVIPVSKYNYDITSQSDEVCVLPYYYFNIMKSCFPESAFTKRQYDETDIRRDLTYKRHNELLSSHIYGVQLWLGGKSHHYQKTIDYGLVRQNIDNYLNLLCNSE